MIRKSPIWCLGAATALTLAVGTFVAGSSHPALATTRGYLNPNIRPLYSGGWEEVGSVSIPQGRTSQFVHADCPAAYPVAVNGAFAFNSAGQASAVSLGYNGPRIDENPPDYQEWGWHFSWASGAPSGVAVSFALFCSRRE
jgi:hypothetical protein